MSQHDQQDNSQQALILMPPSSKSSRKPLRKTSRKTPPRQALQKAPRKTSTKVARRVTPGSAPRSAPSNVSGEDPRFAARRKKVAGARQRRKIRLRIYPALCVMILTGLGIWLVFFSSFMDVNKVEISGTVRTSQVLPLTEKLQGQPLATVNIKSVRANIQDLTWVKEVTASRSWRNASVLFNITERTPIATVHTPKGLAFLDRHGVATELVDSTSSTSTESPPGYPLIEGNIAFADSGWPVSNASLTGALAVLEQLNQTPQLSVGTDITAIVIGEDTDTYLRLNTRGWVRIGDSRELPEKLRSILAVLSQIDIGCDQLLDVRSPSTPAVTSNHDCNP